MSRLLAVGLLLSAAFLPSVAVAEETSEYLTWVRHFRVHPGHERDFIEAVKQNNGETLDGLVTDGSLLSWGILVPFSRAHDDWTHAIWLSTTDWAHMDKVIGGFEAAEKARSELENEAVARQFRELVEAGSVRDEVLRNVVVPAGQRYTESGARPAYLRVAWHQVKPGHAKQAVELYKRIAVPVYEQLMAEGAVVACALAVRETVPDTEWTHMSWTMVGNLGAMDHMAQAFAQAEEARPEQERLAIEEEVRECLDVSAYRSQLLRIVHLGGPKGG
jgi:hypothetical protein